VSGVPDAAAALARAGVEADAVALVKDLFNQPPLDLYPETFVHAAREAVGHLPVAVRVWDEQALADEGFGGILGVGQGSSRGPRLAKLSYEPAGATRHLALVGKGITFDSGGLSLKPPTGMIGMKGDMTGAAVALAALRAIAELELPVRVTAWLCLAENMPSGTAIRPGDVLRIRGGKTVEVLNTDAEGRLVMADGLVAASEEHPDQIIDVATLTGAKVTALGVRYSAVMGDDDLVAQLRTAAAEAGELFWPMPLPDELRATINSGVADIANANPGVPAGGMLLAGIFLREFVGAQAGGGEDGPRIPWAHLDIAGSEENKGAPYGFTGKGGTGVSVRLLVRHAERLAGTAGAVD
jgi:leucyl aminopeptidase